MIFFSKRALLTFEILSNRNNVRSKFLEGAAALAPRALTLMSPTGRKITDTRIGEAGLRGQKLVWGLAKFSFRYKQIIKTEFATVRTRQNKL